MKDDKKNTGEIVIFKTSENNVSIDVRFEGETVWLTQAQMADLYQSSRTNVVEHIKHIYDRADSDKDFMGLTSFKVADVTLEDVRIAKNYLSEKELKKLNALVSAFFDCGFIMEWKSSKRVSQDFKRKRVLTTCILQSIRQKIITKCT